MNGLTEEASSALQVEENEDAVSMSEGEVTDFLKQIEDLTPTIPDVVAAHYLNKAGVDTMDPRIYVLTLEDLAPTLAEYGIVVKKPAYYT